MGPIQFLPRLPTSAIPVTWSKNNPLCFSVTTETVTEPGFEPKPNPCIWPSDNAESHKRDAMTIVVTNSGQESLEKSCFCYSPSEQLELPIPLPSHNNFNFITPTEDMVLVKDKSRNSLILHNFLYWEYLHRRAQIYRQEQSKCLKQNAPNLASPLDLLCDLRKSHHFSHFPFLTC